jgi:tRNA G18 (ribose-2'-O)-methylase SpoU
MPIVRVDDIDDPRLAPFRSLKDRELARSGGRFIAEGEHVVRRLLESAVRCESLLLAQRRADEIAPLAAPSVSVFVVPDDAVEKIVGFKFHSGVLACGLRVPSPTIDELASRWAERVTLVLCQDVGNAENLGGLIRIAAGLGADAMVLGERCADPYFRRSIRVSMGAVFSLPIVCSLDLLADIARLRTRWGVEVAATLVAGDAQSLEQASRPQRFALLLGGEAQGLDAAHVAACDRRITIPMHWGTDSLNVAVAAGVMLYHFTRP